MADTTTTNLGLVKPEVGASTDTWGTKVNNDLDAVDALFSASGALAIANGGTGAATAADARTALDAAGVSDTQTLTNKTIDIASNTLTGVQPTLVSGTNIKTINGGSVLGSGDLAITGGSWTKLSSATAYLSNIVDFTGFVTSEYNTYAVVLYAFSVQSGGSYAAFRFFVGGTIQTSGYTGSGFYSDASGTLVARGGSSGTSAQLVQLTNATNTDQAGVIFINANNFNSATGTSIPSVNSQIGGGAFNTNFYQSGSLNTTSPITGIRFYAVGGTLAGYFDLYGIKR